MKTPEEYKNSLRNMRPNIYKFDELIEDVTSHPATKRTVAGHAQIFASAQDEKFQDIVTTKSSVISPVGLSGLLGGSAPPLPKA